MTYCISDLHGCYDRYLRLLDRIGLNDSDTLYILGDCIDRGARGIDILLDISERPNAIFLMGNHEYYAASLLQWIGQPLPPGVTQNDLNLLYRGWLDGNGGLPTYRQYRSLSPEQQKSILNLIFRAPYHTELRIADQRFHLSHTLPEYEIWKQGCRDTDYIEGEPDYNISYTTDCLLVTGHTPTGLIDPKKKGQILRQNNHIAIDCGTVFGNPLGCIRLEDLKEFYV